MSTALDYQGLDDAGLAGLARSGDRAAFRVIMERCNQRLFRIARAVLGDEVEAEDILQEVYLRTFAALPSYRGEASLFTWLTAITLNEARTRLRRRRRGVELSETEARPVLALVRNTDRDPEAEAARAQARSLIEHAVDALPPDFRLVFVLREVEGCSVAETAAQIGLAPATVKTRLHRARALLRRALDATLADALTDLFPFLGARCARITSSVLERLEAERPLRPASAPVSPASTPARG